MDTNEKLRLDKYLWAIRMFKTRTQASDAITGGKVKWNGFDVKASRQVQVGDQYEIKREAGEKQLIQVVALLQTRVQFSEAVNFYVDLTSEEEKNKKLNRSAFSFNTGKRMSKQGRPTKKDRRELGDMKD